MSAMGWPVLQCHIKLVCILKKTKYVIVSQLIPFARVSSHVADFNARNKI